MLHKYPKVTLLLLLVLFLGLISTLIITRFLSKSRVPGLSTFAFYYQGIPITCENNCSADTCNENSQTDPCCDDIKRTGDPFACPWPQRGYCNDSQCASIPSGVNRQRCGAPKHHWCDICTGSCCLNSDGTINHIPEFPIPSFNGGCPSTIVWAPGHGPSQPTATPSTQRTPTPRPRLTPTPAPTQYNQPTPTIPYSTIQPTPTNSPFIQISQTPTSSPTTIIPFLPTGGVEQNTITPTQNYPSFSFNLPNIGPILKSIDTFARPPLDILEAIFNTTVHYDRLLENAINSRIKLQ